MMTSAAVSAAASGAHAQSGSQAPSLRGPYIDLTTGKGNLIAKCRMNGNLDEGKEKYGTASGIVSGVRDGEAVRDLFGFEVFSVGRLEKQPDGSYRNYHGEVIYYTDLKSGEILSEYLNPYTNERVKVVDVVNDPWNELYEEFWPRPPSYGGLNKVDDTPRQPYILNWRELGAGMIGALRSINLFYKSALQPDKWPRESAGPMSRVTETYTYIALLSDMQDPKKTSIETTGTWTRVTPWLPWMLMGQAPGHIKYESLFANYDDINRVKRNVLDHTQKYHPEMMKAPSKESWSKPNLSSLEVYARTQKPAPPRQGNI
jgi:hypothetical protein